MIGRIFADFIKIRVFRIMMDFDRFLSILKIHHNTIKIRFSGL